MADMLEALRQAGVVSSSDAEKARKKETERLLRVSAVHNRPAENPASRAANLENLASAESIRAFRVIAKQTLLTDPSMIHRVVTAAHRFKGEEGSQRFIASILQLRSDLATADRESAPEIITRALRGAGRTI